MTPEELSIKALVHSLREEIKRIRLENEVLHKLLVLRTTSGKK